MTSFFGLLNLDKSAGMSSRTAVDAVQRLAGTAKVGHAGTLDPIATGVLVLGVGAATRLTSFVQEGRKTYRATFQLGATSITDDVEGVVTALPDAPHLTADQIADVLPEFVGRIEQVPPVFSAVHVNGRRAYELARKGEIIELAARSVDVYRFELVEYDEATQRLVTEIECGAGTYVRSLGRDLAKRLGTAAVMTELQRTAVGPFTLDEAVSLSELTSNALAAQLRPAGLAVTELPRVDCDGDAVAAIRHGRAVPRPDGLWLKPGESVAVFDSDGQLVAITSFDQRDATLRPKIVLPVDETAA